MKRKLRILAAGDLHGDSLTAERLAIKAEKERVNLVLLTGDLTHGDSSSENLIGPFLKRGIEIMFIPGNHDSLATAYFLSKKYGIRNLHGYSIIKDGVGIFGCGGATNVGPCLTITESELFEKLKKAHDYLIGRVKKTIMITHMHPQGGLMEKFSEFVPPSTGVRKAIDELKPEVLLCSHVHEAEGIEEVIGNTRVINVGKEGKILEI